MLNIFHRPTPPQANLIIFPPSDIAPAVAFSKTSQSWLAFTASKPARCILNGSDDDEDGYDYEAFQDEHCDGCEFFFDEEAMDDDEDDDGNTIRRTRISLCSAYRNGLSSVFNHAYRCVKDLSYDEEANEHRREHSGETVEFDLGQLMIAYNPKQSTQAGLCCWDYIDGQLHITPPSGCLNVGNDYGNVCWGGGSVYTFSSHVSNFVTSTFNEDLLHFDAYENLADEVEYDDMEPLRYSILLRHPVNDGSRQPAAALQLSKQDAEFLVHMNATGLNAEVCEEGIIPLYQYRHLDINGFITPPIPTIPDRCWFISVEGYLLCQVDTPPPEEPVYLSPLPSPEPAHV